METDEHSPRSGAESPNNDARQSRRSTNARKSKIPATSESTKEIPDNELDEHAVRPLLRVFYKNLFPFADFGRWLSYGDLGISRREFSFTLANDIYLRFQSFESAEDFKFEVLQRDPVKIDLGAVYNKPLDKRIKRDASLVPVEKEFVLDIDLTDYDDVRTCCSGAGICPKCWVFLAAAVRVLDDALRLDFGFSKLLWVYSGRRGVHCWVCDAEARRLDNQRRAAIVKFLEVVKGGENAARKVRLPYTAVHPSLLRAIAALQHDYFESRLLVSQNLLADQAARDRLLGAIPDDLINRSRLSSEIAACAESDPAGAWGMLEHALSGTPAGVATIRDLMLQCVYPRLDAKVSTNIGHLLKSPFCVHPKTGRICVPFDPASAASFNPRTVPTINTLIEEISNRNVSEEEAWEKSSLRPYLLLFKTFVGNLEREHRRQLLQEMAKTASTSSSSNLDF